MLVLSIDSMAARFEAHVWSEMQVWSGHVTCGLQPLLQKYKKTLCAKSTRMPGFGAVLFEGRSLEGLPADVRTEAAKSNLSSD